MIWWPFARRLVVSARWLDDHARDTCRAGAPIGVVWRPTPDMIERARAATVRDRSEHWRNPHTSKGGSTC